MTKALIGWLLTIMEVLFAIIAHTEAVPEGYILILRREVERLGLSWAFKTSKSTFSGTLSSARPHLLIP